MRSAALGWDAETYHKVSAPQQDWGLELIQSIAWRGDETVVDAGCGTGVLTKALAERIPRGRVLAFDSDAAMIAKARETLAAEIAAGRAEVRQAGVYDFAPAEAEKADLLFSNAVFHWVPDHARLWRAVAGWMMPGGRLVAQYGGQGNLGPEVDLIRRITSEAPFERSMGPEFRTTTFSGEAETRAMLEAAGFASVTTSLEPRLREFADEPAYEAFLKTVILRPYRQFMPEAHWDLLLREFMARMAAGPGRVLHYVRLTVRGRREGA